MKDNAKDRKPKRKEGKAIWYAILGLGIGLLAFGIYSMLNPATEPLGSNHCSAESRTADVCYDLYKPVCGWFNQSIQCFKYPCAATYSNECFACQDPKVAYWTEGECPQ